MTLLSWKAERLFFSASIGALLAIIVSYFFRFMPETFLSYFGVVCMNIGICLLVILLFEWDAAQKE